VYEGVVMMVYFVVLVRGRSLDVHLESGQETWKFRRESINLCKSVES
jgi:hypothetical protein